jgi:hypothetical protein
MSNAPTPTPSVLALRQRMSFERMGPYEQACSGDHDKAFALYEWNCAVSGAFFEALGLLEVALRNALHDQLTRWHAARYRTGHWYDDPSGVLEAHRARDIADARGRLQRQNKAETPGGLVTELSFGFWRFLLTSRYEPSLWTPALRHAFPALRPARRHTVYVPVNELVRLRNRVAHHEPIYNRPLLTLHGDLLRVAGYVDQDLASWIRTFSRLPALLPIRPTL